MIFRNAVKSDLPEIMNIIREAQIALGNLKIDQWQNGYPSENIINDDIENEFCYVLSSEETIIACCTVIYNYEPSYLKIYDGKWLSEDDFVVVHRIAVKTNFRRSGIALLLFNKIIELAISNKVYSLKIDTHEGNIPMQNLLKKLNFSYCGIIFLENRDKRLAFEKILKVTNERISR
ncbi:MAG: GNAT family N-acetyltransferase [Bacteroidales bacterium]|jgi:ribosomal protein S18 acetylase RimI-like enzyme|nr:GNAT family N-acetyltransferase [Bacteroidales bacterium]